MTNNALSQYFPFLETQRSDDALAGTQAIASVGIAMLKMFETLLPAAASEVEHESLQLMTHFSTLIDYLENQPVPPHVREAMSGILVALQFQDRNTQIMDNVAGMIERYRVMLEDISGTVDALRNGAATPGHTVAHAVEDILSSIRLSELRSRYLDALAKAKVHTNGISTGELPSVPDIELF